MYILYYSLGARSLDMNELFAISIFSNFLLDEHFVNII